MKINKVVICGMDDQTDIKQLEDLKKKYPFVEWGVLFSTNRRGKARYPSISWIEEFLNSETGNVSAHFCGSYPRDILEVGNIEEILNLSNKFDSIQLNYNLEFRKNKWKKDNLILALETSKKLNKDIILQFNEFNKPYIDYELIYSYDNIRFLNDSSGGNGKVIKELTSPVSNIYTGYAGGINLDNIDLIVNNITSFDNQDTVWIDLESGARIDNIFDINTVDSILSIVKQKIN